MGTLLRGTLHLVSAREHPAYARVVEEARGHFWRRTKAEPGPQMGELLDALLDFARAEPRGGDDIARFLEDFVKRHPDALDAGELARQRELKWRPFLRWSALVRAPADGRWGAKAPAALRGAPGPKRPPGARKALEEAIRRHLRAFGPAAAEDVACWLGAKTPPVREALERMEGDLERVDGLYDLPGAPRPDPGTPAPPRLLAAFDSVLLAYASGRRARIISDRHRDAVYEGANLRIKPSFTVDGLVAGTWSVEVKRRQATVTLQPLQKVTKAARSELAEEAERLAMALYPDAKAHAAGFS